MKIFITGAGGFLGTHVLFQLLGNGHEVTALLRQGNHPVIQHENLTLFHGDITRSETLSFNSFKNFDAVIHIAATTDTTLLHYHDFEKVNLQGTQNVLQLAKNTHAKRFIYVSTANTVGYGSWNQLANEDSPIQKPFTHSFYAQSKREAEKWIMENAKGMDWVIVNPAFMLGSYDFKPTSGQLVLLSYGKRMVCIPKGGKNFVHVEDVAAGIVNALTTTFVNEKFLLGNINLSFKEYYKLQAKMGNYKQQIIVLPHFVMKFTGVLGDILRSLGIKINLSRANLAQLCIQEYYDCSKARNLLNLPQTPLPKAIYDAVEWFKQNGKIKNN